MRNLVSLLGVLVLVLTAGGGHTLRAAPLEPAAPQSPSEDATSCASAPPASGWRCVNGAWLPPLEPPAPPPPIPTEVISADEEVMFTLTNDDWYRTFELTAPSDGTLIVSLSGALDGIGVFINGNPNFYDDFATHEVVAGETYLIEVAILVWEFMGSASVALTTSISSVPLVLPPLCLTVQPGPDWVCATGGNWVPPGHPDAEGVVTVPQPAPPTIVPQPAAPSGGAIACPTIRPGPDWVCVTGGNWVQPGHPLTLSAPASPTPSSPPPAPTTGCTTPDPFAGIPGMVGVCIGNNTWVPVGHPLAGGGG